MADSTTQLQEGTEPSTPVPAAGNLAQARQTLQCDDSGAPALYCNFARITGTPEEVILDFGLNPEPLGVPKKPINVSQKLVMSYFTAKRVLAALHVTLQRHEAAFGVLQPDVNKRLRDSKTSA